MVAVNGNGNLKRVEGKREMGGTKRSPRVKAPGWPLVTDTTAKKKQ
jgi:hypothetical protein